MKIYNVLKWEGIQSGWVFQGTTTQPGNILRSRKHNKYVYKTVVVGEGKPVELFPISTKPGRLVACEVV